MKKGLCLMIALAMLLSMTAATAESILLTWNEVNGEAYGATVGAHAFAERMEALSGGTMQIDLYTNGALGSEQESLQGLQIGTLDFFRGNASTLPDYGADLIGATGFPFLFDSMEQFYDFATGELGKALLESVETADCGFVALAWLVEGPRSLFITDAAYHRIGAPESVSLSDIKGLNIRVPESSVIHDTIDALGMAAIPITYSELVRSLQSGNVDGAENGVTSYISSGFCEVAPYFIEDAHIFGCGVILMSKARWDALTDAQKGWVREAAQAASDACYEYNRVQEEACFDRFDTLGVKLLPVTDIDRWQDACEPLYERQSDETQAIIDQIQSGEF